MNVGELLRERDRLLGVLEEAKSAKSKLRQVNVLIAMYGTPEDAAAASNGHAPAPVPLYCETCGDARPFKGRQGLAVHMRKAHGATKARKAARK